MSGEWRYRSVDRSGPAIRSALAAAAPDELPEFEAQFRIALAEADDDFDLSRVDRVVAHWWVIAILRANPIPLEERLIGDWVGSADADELEVLEDAGVVRFSEDLDPRGGCRGVEILSARRGPQVLAELIVLSAERLDDDQLGERMSRAWSWIRALPPEDRVSCVEELVAAARGSERDVLMRTVAARTAERSADLNRRCVEMSETPWELTTTEAARQLGVTRPTVVKWIKDGNLAAHMVGSHYRVLAEDVMEFARARREEQMRAFERLREVDEALGLDT